MGKQIDNVNGHPLLDDEVVVAREPEPEPEEGDES